ncbi:hypothetical protein T492DRAFT_973946 [Pavlovales sp. CCMP2436]|nr:hypothetical protein T492DRAFT_973946 [Pavlovales sp. CCMP2436]
MPQTSASAEPIVRNSHAAIEQHGRTSSPARPYLVLLGAVAVALAALVAPCVLHVLPDVDAVGTAVLRVLTSEWTAVGGPVAYLRFTMPAVEGESLRARLLHSLAVTAVALWLFVLGGRVPVPGRYPAEWPELGAVLLAQACSYALAQPAGLRRATGFASCLLGALALCAPTLGSIAARVAACCAMGSFVLSALEPRPLAPRLGAAPDSQQEPTGSEAPLQPPARLAWLRPGDVKGLRFLLAGVAGLGAAAGAKSAALYVLPVHELAEAFSAAHDFAGDALHAHAAKLVLILIHTQVHL